MSGENLPDRSDSALMDIFFCEQFREGVFLESSYRGAKPLGILPSQLCDEPINHTVDDRRYPAEKLPFFILDGGVRYEVKSRIHRRHHAPQT